MAVMLNLFQHQPPAAEINDVLFRRDNNLLHCLKITS